MPSGKKQYSLKAFKPSSNYVHPSLAIRDRSSPVAAEPSTSVSDSERLDHLRRTQGPRVTTPASLEDLKTRSQTPATVPRRRFAGPPPPRSWVEDEGARRNLKYGTANGDAMAKRPSSLLYFPGLKPPSPDTLVHHSLKSLALDFEWHVEYDHTYLSVLPLELKELLLSYVAVYSTDQAMSIEGLRVLFNDNDAKAIGSTDSEGLRRLDLGGSIGRGLTVKELDKYLQVKSKAIEENLVLESWDLAESLSTTARFPWLTKLSLAYPGPSATWTDLLSLSKQLGALTHLSLDAWPRPALLATTVPGAAQPAGKSEGLALSEAAYLLRQLSRATPSLQLLSLQGCSAWLGVLIYAPPATTSKRVHRTLDFSLGTTQQDSESIWISSWRNISILQLGQGWIPEGVDVNLLSRLYKSRGKWDPASPINFAGLMPSLPQAVAASQPREFPRPDQSSTGPSSSQARSPAPYPQREQYTITGSPSVVNSIEATMHRRQWCLNEIQPLQVGDGINALRRQNGHRLFTIDYGWDKADLVAAGYDEDALFHAGF